MTRALSRSLTVLALALGSSGSLAAQGITVTLSVSQPTPYLADWETNAGVVTLIVSNGSGFDVDATTSLRLLRNQAVVGTLAADLTTFPATSSIFSGPQIAQWSQMKFTGSVASSVNSTGRIPEGSYQLCVDLTNVTASGRPLNDVTGCGFFTVTFPQPPKLITPFNAAPVTSPYPTFQWTPVIAPGVPQVDYLLRVVEVLPGQTPLQAVTGNVPVLEQALTTVTAAVYPPSALPLEDGKHYAWRVQAIRSLQGEVGNIEPVGANQGRSEIFTFTRKAPGGGPTVAVQPPVVGQPGGAFPYWNASLSGTLKYTFRMNAVPAPKKVAVPSPGYTPIFFTYENPPPGGLPPNLPIQGVAVPPPGGPQAVGNPPGPDPGPLAGVTVRLVVRYRTSAGGVFGPIYAGGKSYTDNGQVIATATTQSDGKFGFLFHDDNPTGVIASNTAINWGSGDIVGSTTGSLVRFYNLEVGDGHFLNPSDELTLGPNRTANVGTLVSLVRSYRTVVKVVKANAPAEVLPAVTVQVVRGYRPPAVPVNEGSAPGPRKTLQQGLPNVYYVNLPSWTVIGEHETGADGTTFLSRLVKNVGTSDRYYVRVSTPAGGLLYYETAFLEYSRSWPGLGPQGDLAYYNEQYGLTKTDTLIVKLVPRKARYVGRLMRQDTTSVPIRYGRADLCYNFTCTKRYIEPEDDGYFSFSDITPATKTPPFWRVDVGSLGFIPQSKDSLGLLLGTQSTKDVYYLQPDAHVKGRIVDENNQPAFGYVQVEEGPWVAAKPAFGTPQGSPVGYQLSPQLFQFGPVGQPAPAQPAAPQQVQAKPILPGQVQPGQQVTAGNQQIIASGPIQISAYVFDFNAVSGTQHLRINGGPKYFPLDTTVTIPKGGPTNLGTFTLHRRLHRLRLSVTGGVGRLDLPGDTKPVPGAIAVLSLSGSPTDTADANGIVEFTWQSPNAADSTVTVTLTGPAGSDYIGITRTLQVPESPAWTAKHLRLQEGTSIAGTVYAGQADSVPVAGARVFADLGQAGLVETMTGTDGKYVLHGVTTGNHVVRAGKSNSNFIGDSITVTAKRPSTPGQDFHLRYYDGMDISHLYGFAIEVHDLQDLPGGRALIRGAFTELPDNGAFAPGVTSLPFDSVTIQSDGTPAKHALPTAGVILLRDNVVPLDPFGSGKYLARQRNTSGLVVRPVSGGTGAVFGPIELDVAGSFTNVTSSEIDSLGTPFLLKTGATGQDRTILASITADSSSPAGPQGYNLGTATGGPLGFRLFGFRAEADPTTSFLKPDAVYLGTVLHTDIQGVADLAVKIPALRMAPGPAPIGGISSVSDSQPISVKLGGWTLQASSWNLAAGGGKLYLAEGQVLVPLDPTKPNATVAFPFTGVQVTPTSLGGGNFGTGPVMLAGIVPLTSSQPISFGMEKAGGPWVLTSLGGTIPALDGMDPGSSIAIGNFSFRSDGTSGLTAANNASVRYYQTADYAIKAIGVTQTAVQFNGNLDIHVPNLGPQAFIFTYSKAGGQVKLVQPPLSFQAFDVGGAKITLKDGVLDPTGFHSGGALDVTGKWNIPIEFTRSTLNAPAQVISAVPAPGATLAIGQILVDSLKGGSKVAGGQWSTRLDGHMDVNNGEATGPVSFTVSASDVAVGSTGLTVRQIPTPFGNITVTLNYPLRRLEGHMQVSKQLAAGANATGTAELAISGLPSDQYWYFFGGLNVTLANPGFSGTAALIIGNAKLSGTLLNDFNAYSTKGVPASFHTINGFFLEGKMVVPVPICPNGSFDVGVGSVAVWCNVWGDIRLGMNFQELNTYHVGMEAGVNAGAKGGVGLGACLHVSGSVAAQGSLEGEYRSDGAWYVLGGYDLDLHGTVSGGVGID
ncbi:MAG: carboxypeptidase-like regulatory domain-containing protein, partial [Gemmatimonadales bacterium]